MFRSYRFRLYLLVVLFVAAATWFFVPVGKPQEPSLLFSLRLALPAALLAVGGIGLLPWPMSIGFVFCALGDAMGVMGSFEGQMGGFAVAHVCFIGWFVSCIHRQGILTRQGFSSKQEEREPIQGKDTQAVRDLIWGKGRVPFLIILTVLFCTLPLVAAFLYIIPKISDPLIRIGCIVYSLLLTATLWTAWVRKVAVHPTNGTLTTAIRTRFRSGLPTLYATLSAAGATSFFISDYILAWNKFTSPVPHASALIMTTYYAALLLLFLGEAAKNKEK